MSKVAPLNATPDLAGTASTGPAPSAAPARASLQPPVEAIADFRLVIEEDPETGTFVYKTLDRRTGEVVNQFPREQVLRLRETEGYTPGIVFNGQS
jgi:flagellar protein FlaG